VKLFKPPMMVVGLCTAVLLGVAGLQAHGQRDAAGKDKSSVGVDDSSFIAVQKKRKKPRGRLPNYYGKVGVSEEQREKIYAIQAMYRPKIEALEKQIAELKAKEDAEVEAVLTPEQKKKVEESRAAAAKKRAERRKKRKKKKSE